MKTTYRIPPKYKAYIVAEDNALGPVDVKSIHIGTGKIMYGYSEHRESKGVDICFAGSRSELISNCVMLQYIGVTDASGQELYEYDILKDSEGKSYYIKRVIEDGFNGYALFTFRNEALVLNWNPKKYTKVDNVFNPTKK